MADKLKADKPGASRLDVKALKRAISDINKHKEQASEYTGLSGQATKNACETYGFNRKALTFVAGLQKKEPSQQLEVLGAMVSYAHAMGMFEQMDMFNDCVHAMQAVIENAAKGGAASGAAPGAANVSNLAAGTTVN
jgi:hypothetical protein